MNHITPEQRAYIAGIIDGEGTISITGGMRRIDSRKKPYRGFNVTFRVSNTDTKLMEWLLNTTGIGKVRPAKTTIWANSNLKQLYVWEVSTNGIRELLPSVIRYLVTKKRQAEITILWLKRFSGRRGKNMTPEIFSRKMEVVREMMALNKRGL